jgi:hypothetical protein
LCFGARNILNRSAPEFTSKSFEFIVFKIFYIFYNKNNFFIRLLRTSLSRPTEEAHCRFGDCFMRSVRNIQFFTGGCLIGKQIQHAMVVHMVKPQEHGSADFKQQENSRSADSADRPFHESGQFLFQLHRGYLELVRHLADCNHL